MRALVLFAMLSAVQTAWAGVVDRIEVVVEDQLVMTSDLAVDSILQRLDDSPSPFWRDPPADPAKRLADAALMRHLASDLAIYQPSQAEVQRRLDALVLGQFENRRAWLQFVEQWGLDEASVRTLLKRRLLVERYLRRNLVVPPEDLELWWSAYERLMATERARARIRFVDAVAEP